MREHVLPGACGVRMPVMLFLLLVAVARTHALIDSFHTKLKGDVLHRVVADFGLEKGGTATLTLTDVSPPSASVYLLLVSRDQASELRSAAKNEDEDRGLACMLPAFARLQSRDDGSEVQVKVTVPDVGRYSLYVASCLPPSSTAEASSGGDAAGGGDGEEGEDETGGSGAAASDQGGNEANDDAGDDSLADDDIEVRGRVVLLNPNGQHLSKENVPLMLIFGVLLAGYIVALVVWLTVVWRNRPAQRRLHSVISLALFCKVLDMASKLAFFGTQSVTGKSVLVLEMLMVTATIATSVIFLVALVLTALGWTITRQRLTRRELQLLAVSFILFLLLSLLMETCHAHSLCEVYRMSFQVVKFLISFGVIAAMNANMERLRARTNSAPDMAVDEQLEIYLKLQLFSSFRWTFFIYLVFPVALLFIDVTIVRWQESWMLEMLQESLILYVYVMLTATFRPQVESEYTHLIHPRQPASSDGDDGADAASGPGETRHLARQSEDADADGVRRRAAAAAAASSGGSGASDERAARRHAAVMGVR